jgi:hypothetical protein
MTSSALTHEILAEFNSDALTFTEEGTLPVIIPYHEHPRVFGHPRFFMADFDNSATLVRKALLQLKGGRFPLIAPKIVVRFHRPVSGGVVEMDCNIINQIFTEAGASTVVFRRS